MRFGKEIASILVFIPLVFSAKGQSEVETIEEGLLEYIAENAEEELDFSEVTEHLRTLQQNPLNLNKASKEQLGELYILNPLQISHLLYHRETTGAFHSIFELQGVEGFDAQVISLLQNFVTVEEDFPYSDLSLKMLWEDADQELMLRYGRTLDKAAGYLIKDENRSRYLGSPDQWNLRYRMNYKNTAKISLTMTKGAGEPFMTKDQPYGFDFISGSLSMNRLKNVNQLVVGDYALQLGQGLIMWNGLSFGKGAWATSMAKQGVQLKPYTSTNENQFLRGTAVNFSYGKFNLTSFASFKKIDGNIEWVDDEKRILSRPISGLHRTPSELKNRKTVRETLMGQHIGYSANRLNVGATFISTFWDGNIIKRNALRHAFDFEGNNLNALSVNYDYTFKNLYVYGETSHSFGGGLAVVNGLIASLHPSLSVFIHQRYFAKNYWQVYAQGVGESSLVNNEKGLYAGFVYHPSRNINWFIHADIFSFPWLRYRADGPSYGRDLFTQFEYIWYKKGKVSFRYRNKMRQENSSMSPEENLIVDIHRHQFRVEFQYTWNDKWKTRTRGEYLLYYKELEGQQKGGMVYQDVFYNPPFYTRIQFNMRLAHFQTDSYDTRLYAYENDVLYASAFPFYYLKGWRSYLNVRFKISNKLDFWSRYAFTVLPAEKSISSGLNQIEGNKRRELKLQLRWKL